MSFILAVLCAQDFVPLFNGKDLGGWVVVNGGPPTWTVRDGLIVCSGKPTGVMRTEKMYENYVLELEWKHLTQTGNAGLFVHSDAITAPGQPFTRSIEVQVMLMDKPHPKGLYTGQGDIFSIHGATFVPDRPHPEGWQRCLPSEERTKGAGEWNHYRVESRDGKVSLAVNGKVVSGGTKCNPRKGYICLEAEGSEIHFRNPKIQELPSSGAPPEETATADVGFRSIFNGTDLAGWAEAPGWKVKDWVLDYDGAGSDLWSLKEYGDFELIADWRRRGPSASGIALRGGSGKHVTVECPTGGWNRVVVTMKGDRLTVALNGKAAIENVPQPGVPARGKIALLPQGGPVQFANLYIRELN